MNTVKKISGIALAAAAAAMFTAAPTVSAEDLSKEAGKCVGVNGCKGKSACATATSKCKGLNSCKGSGFLKMSAADCTEKGGKFEKIEKKEAL